MPELNQPSFRRPAQTVAQPTAAAAGTIQRPLGRRGRGPACGTGDTDASRRTLTGMRTQNGAATVEERAARPMLGGHETHSDADLGAASLQPIEFDGVGDPVFR